MKSTIALTLAVAAATVSAQNCNPSYNTPTSTPCFTKCNVDAGNTFMSGWTMDHTSPKFLESLSIMCNKGTPEYTAFMTKAGMCMVGCAGDDPEKFNAEFAGACTWYAAHKNDKCDGGEVVATTTAAPAETTTTPAASSATSAASAAASNASSAASAVASAVSSAQSAVSSAVSSAVNPPASSSASPSASASVNNQNAPNAASKLQLSGYAMALVAGAGYLAL